MSFTVEINTCCHIKEVSEVGVFKNQEWISWKIGEDLEKQELSYVASESVKFYNHTGEFFPSIYYSSRHQKKKKNHITQRPRNSTQLDRNARVWMTITALLVRAQTEATHQKHPSTVSRIIESGTVL